MSTERNKEQAGALKQYEYTDAVETAKAYFKGDDLAATVWVSKYALKDSMGKIYENSPEQMHRRIAREIERIEKRYPNPMSESEVYDLLKDFRYLIPQGGPMTGIGNNLQIASLSNCFVIGHRKPADSYGGIIRIDEEQVQLMKRRGGVGHDLSHIRPTGSPVLNSALTSTGIVPFMERYSNSTREVAQDGRRGALMLSLSIKHPDAENFIDAKVETGKVTGANVSIKIDDEFMRAVTESRKYHQQFPIDSDKPMYEKDIDARALWNKIVHNAWKSAEPGILFWDTILRESVPDCYADLGFRTVSTNPCGEIPLCPYDSCRLLAINLYSYVDKPFSKEASFDFGKFRSHVAAAMRIMDDIVDLELEKIEAIIEKISKDPEEEDIRHVEHSLWEKIREKALKGRRTGLGITAEGDMLAALGLRYGTDEAIDFAVDMQKTLALEAYRASVIMAEERGQVPDVRSRTREGQPDDRPHPRGRSGSLRGDDPTRPPQHRDADDRPDGYDEPDVADDFGHRTGVPAGLHASSQGQPERQGREDHLRRRSGRLVGGIQRVPPQVPRLARSQRVRPERSEKHVRRRDREARRAVSLLQGDGQRYRLG